MVAEQLFEFIDRADFPDGVIQLLHGSADTVNALVEHDDIVGAPFVGSTPVAKAVCERGATHGKRVQAQGGAKNHIIITESAGLNFAAHNALIRVLMWR